MVIAGVLDIVDWCAAGKGWGGHEECRKGDSCVLGTMAVTTASERGMRIDLRPEGVAIDVRVLSETMSEPHTDSPQTTLTVSGPHRTPQTLL